MKAEVKEIILGKGQKGVIVQKGEDRYRIGKEALNTGCFGGYIFFEFFTAASFYESKDVNLG